jgi:hypothetical protein
MLGVVMASKKAAPKPEYRILTGMNYEGKRVEAGDVVDDIPNLDVEWLLHDGHIEKVEEE